VISMEPEGSQSHLATFEQGALYFTFVFDSDFRDATTVAQRLLKRGVAEASVSPRDGQVRMAPRYRALDKQLRRADALGDLDTALTDGNLISALRAYPRMAPRFAWAFARGITSEYLRPSKSDESGVSADRESATPRDDDSMTEGASYSSPDGEASDGEPSVARQMADLREEISLAVADRQAVAAIQHARDSDMYQPGYLADEPFLRLTLRRAACVLAEDSGKKPIDVPIDVLLMVHRSGVLQLTFALAMPEGVDSDNLVRLSMASRVMLAQAVLSEPVLRHAARHTKAAERRWLGAWEPEINEGVRWRKIEFSPPMSLVDLFKLYQDAVISAGGLDRVGDWLCYATVFVDRLGCCRSEDEWSRNHKSELMGLLLRHGDHGNLRPEAATALAPRDSSLTVDKSVWLGIGSTLVISWEPQDSFFDEHLWTVLLIEAYLLQYWQLRALRAELQRTKGEARAARDLQRRLVLGLEEVYNSGLMYGSAEEDVHRLIVRSGSEDALRQLTDQVNQLGAIIAAERAEAGARRAVILSAAAVIAAIVFALPAIDQTLKLAKSIPDSGLLGFMSSPLRSLARTGPSGSWAVFVVLLGLLMVTLVILAARVRRRAVRRPRSVGVVWPGGTIEIVRGSPDEHEVAGRSSKGEESA
jgi:hypothetical protein